MNPPPLPIRDQARIDSEQLNLLSIFHFVAAGFSLLGTMFLLAHYSIMSTVFSNPKMWEGPHSTPPPPEFFTFFRAFKWFYLIGGLWFIGSGILNVISGFFLRSRRNYIFSMVVAAINCLHIPIGTALGVFTIIVLQRESVRQSYGR